jgi:hypothetical protein
VDNGHRIEGLKMFEFVKIKENKPRNSPIQAAILYVSVPYFRMSGICDSIKTFEKYNIQEKRRISLYSDLDS